MWRGSLRAVSVAPHGCQIARGKVIYTADTVVVGGGHTQVSAGEAACVIWQSYILYGWWQVGCKTFIGCRGGVLQNAISLLYSLPSLPSCDLSTGLFVSLVCPDEMHQISSFASHRRACRMPF